VPITATSVSATVGARVGLNFITIIAGFKALLTDGDVTAPVSVTAGR
jgi:hypothetical protein